MKRLVVLAAVVGAFAVPAVASAQAVFEQPCSRVFTDIYYSPFTGHSFISQWTGTDIPRGGPEDGVWRLYAVAVDRNDGAGWQFAYYEWRSCYV